ncbi:LAME_0F04874g1_1 [Lachancea meyersii CBS 8951]|uniref:LAME_0F04874g1_1 n=1 Tax=Lachancea meyersii CBS 8951 TaxID=1266667 RepID=A0A1G4JSE7_9SACH|nr:LAME_0F04874g1_1 [Lachancea meyersii CBS 8951]
MSSGRSHQESVEEAVFKYVGVDLQGGKHNDEGDTANENLHRNLTSATHQADHRSDQHHKPSRPHITEQAMINTSPGTMKKYHHQRLDQMLVRDAQNAKTAAAAVSAMLATNGSHNESSGSTGSGGSPGVMPAGSSTAADVEWFLRHELDPESSAANELDVRGAREPQSVAAAAVAAAFGSSQGSSSNSNVNMLDRKRSRVSESNRVNSVNPLTGRPSNSKRLKSSLESRNSARGSHGQASKIPHLGAVDPELASLDDPEDVTEHEQLVRKAILDADSIAHHPDFQHYLNTEDEPEEKTRLSGDLHQGDSHNFGRKVEVLPKVSGGDIGIGSHTGSHNGSDSISGSRSESGANAVHGGILGASGHSMSRTSSGAGVANDHDISHLIQDAATKASNFISPQSQSTGKSFDAAEEQALEHFIGEYQAIKSLSRRQICERIWSNERRKDDFWTNICKVLPYRTRSSIYKHVRRKYHIFEQRGKWTPEEEQELATLCLEKEGQWSEIGKLLGRMPEDCRDRWRNYVKCGNNRASNKWSPQEEEQLKEVIAELLDSAGSPEDHLYDPMDESQMEGKEKRPAKKKKDSNARDAINWTVVSERMGGARSRIQCRYKWNKLLKKQAMNKIKNISEEDKMWILEKLRDMGFTEDLQVDWDELATLMPGRLWSGTELKLCYEKLRTGVRYHKDRTINQICKELIGIRDEGLPLETGNLLGSKR